jgi:peptidyl-Asp metalloendopeptidase
MTSTTYVLWAGYRNIFIPILIFFSTQYFSCTPNDLQDKPFLPVDHNEIIERIPDYLMTVTEEVIQMKFARYNFLFFERHVLRFTNQPVEIELFDTVSIQFVTDSVTTYNDSIYVWHGTLDARYYGNASLSFSPHSMYGVIQVDQRIYEILPVADDIVRISEIDQSKYPDEAPPIRKDDRMESRNERMNQYDRHERNEFRILVVLPLPTYTFVCEGSFIFPNFLPLLEAVYQNHLNKVFNAVIPSGINATLIFDCINYTPVGGDLSDDLTWVRTDAGVAQLRNRHRADLVSLIVPAGSYCGRGYENYPVEATDEAYAFSVVKASCAIGNYSFAHELGHNIGMRHDRLADDAFSISTCNYGYIFDFNIWFFKAKARSIMAYGSSCNNCPRMGLYSNLASFNVGFIQIGPMGVDCNSAPSAGNYYRANNRQQLIDAAPVVASFR